MAEFQQAYALTARTEGGYANHPADTGGETWAGISRNNWPAWVGWLIVDQLRGRAGFPGTLSRSPELRQQVAAFYKAFFWDALRLSEVVSQTIANEVFDSAVNCGVTKAAVWLQRAMNVTNAGGTKAPDVKPDGKVGRDTLAALNAHKAPLLVFKALNVLQGAHYIALAEASKSQEVFITSWLSRVEL
jgi:lysozyme family protein